MSEHKEYTDFLGNIVIVGTTIVFTTACRTSHTFHYGVITKFSGCRIYYEITKSSSSSVPVGKTGFIQAAGNKFVRYPQ